MYAMFSGTFCRGADLKLVGVAQIESIYSRTGATYLSNSDKAKLNEIFPVSFESACFSRYNACFPFCILSSTALLEVPI